MVSSLLRGEFGLEELYIGVPRIVGKEGNKQVVEVPLSEAEMTAFLHSANTMKGIIENSSL